VRRPGPVWWVKIGDFGISKRAQDGMTELRTMVGTSSFLAPEVIGIFPIEDMKSGDGERERHTYTCAVGIWALGQLSFFIICNKLAFQDSKMGLSRFVVTGMGFPRNLLEQRTASPFCCDFIEAAMTPSRKRRPTATELLRLPWLASLKRAPTAKFLQRYENFFFQRL
jgi:serine/threonine protein kinase